MGKIARLVRHDRPLHFVLLFTNWLPDNSFFCGFEDGWPDLFSGLAGLIYAWGEI